MGLTTFAAEVKPGKYAAAVKELAEATEAWDGVGQAPAWDETFTLVENRKGELSNPEKIAFQRDANAAGYTARARSEKDNGDGTVTVVYTLTEKYKRLTKSEREGGTIDTGADAVEVAEVAPEKSTRKR